ncbi:D-threitol dehydrogenase [Streptosporangium oxazolinicum]|uniref:D-threitol dehydrogenase n=1 Tax=Streptosporangium oxazolinicum TaxID=909287 RepID=A0ABP8ALA9_9ACTN
MAVVTGARQGIGRRIAEVLAVQGYDLALIDEIPPDATVQALKDTGVSALGIVADVSREEDVEAAITTALDRFERLDVLVNNAGISLIEAAEKTTPTQWRRVLDVNLTGPFLLCRAFAAGLLETGRHGSIVNVSSIAGVGGIPDRAAYNASKHGLLGLTRTLALEWGARGIRVNAVCPSFVTTEMDTADMDSGAYTEQDILQRGPLARFAMPGDVAEAVAFLADDSRSGFINAVALPVDGGWLADSGWTSLRMSKR